MGDQGHEFPTFETPKKKIAQISDAEEEEENDSPIEQVRLTVPPTDNPNLPVLTIRTWVLGILSCSILAFVNTFFGYRQNPLGIGSVAAQIITLPLGRLMAATLPDKRIGLPFTNWSFSLNPGPFNLKEHVMITIFAGCGASGVYALLIVTSVKAFYHRKLNALAAFILSQTTMLLGYGWAGMHRKILVDSPYMWWPSNLVAVSLFRTLHEKEKRPKGGLTRLQFFLIALISSFAYYIVPGYYFPTLSCISVACLIWKKSVLAQQLGSGLSGLGIGSFALDWNTVVSFTGSPIATPAFAILNTLAGFIIIVYIIIPAAYWSNVYDAKKFPLYSTQTFDSAGHVYNISRVLNEKAFEFYDEGYNNYSKLHISIFFAFSYGLSFATLAATISHVFLFYWGTIWELTSKTASALKEQVEDVHARLMKKNYKPVPDWWFYSLLIVAFGLSLLCLEGFGGQLQLPWWGLILACGIAWFFTLPVGIIIATTNQGAGLNVITEMIIGYIYPGRPLANVAFKTYGTISMSQVMSFFSDFKVGHYMKIPPRSMFIVQLVGTILSSSINLALLGGFSPPVPVWLLSRKYPDKKWIKLINMPIFLSAAAGMPPGRSVNYIMWGAVGLYFNIYLYQKYKGWCVKHAYILGAALDAGIAFMGILLYFTLQSNNISPEWWGQDNDDHCPLARCPTVPRLVVQDCPVF